MKPMSTIRNGLAILVALLVQDEPGLPRVLLIGDSVSGGYTLATRKLLAGKANVHKAPENCGPTGNGLKKLDIWLGDGHWDVIHFNVKGYAFLGEAVARAIEPALKEVAVPTSP